MNTINEIQLTDTDNLREILPFHNNDESAGLREIIRADGCFTDPIVYWEEQNIILDGRNRMKIWEELRDEGSDIEPPTIVGISLSSMQEAEEWVIKHQINRRNLSPSQKALLVGTRYNQAKSAPGRPEDGKPKETAETIAVESNMPPRSVRRSGEYVDCLNKVGESDPEFRQGVVEGEIKAGQETIIKIAALDDESQKAAIGNLREGRKWNHTPGKPEHIKYLEQAEKLLGDVGTAIYSACNEHEDLQRSTFDPALRELGQLIHSAKTRTV